jgi:type I restriction enzyme R subunit
MLDTGIDVPEVANLVFFKLVRSKTKFWQMIGRGTRLRPDLFGPGVDKEFFFVFDYCQNLEFFSQNPETTDGALGAPLGARVFATRVELIAALDEARRSDRVSEAVAVGYGTLRSETAESLRTEVAAMNPENFVVRPKRELVERWARAEAWETLPDEGRDDLAHEVARLPTELEGDGEEARRFDLLVLRLQLAVLRSEPGFEGLRDRVRALAGLLEEKASIPMVHDALPLIQDVQTDAWWEDVTLPMLEQLRKRLRLLVRFIEKRQRKPVYTDFEDAMGPESEVVLPGTHPAEGYERFRSKARRFLRAHEDHITVQKLRRNWKSRRHARARELVRTVMSFCFSIRTVRSGTRCSSGEGSTPWTAPNAWCASVRVRTCCKRRSLPVTRGPRWHHRRTGRGSRRSTTPSRRSRHPQSWS